MHQIWFRLGLHLRPARGAYSAPPNPLGGFKGPISNGREERNDGREGQGRREVSGVEWTYLQGEEDGRVGGKWRDG